jgi:hypothetical protein
MARTLIRQETQIRNSENYTDNLAAGSTLESGAVSIEDDLNGLRSQIARILNDAGGNNWYDDISTVNGKKRSLFDLNTDLNDIEEKKVLGRAQILTDVTVTAAQNWEILSVSGSEAPTLVAAVATTQNGAVVAQSALQDAAFNVHELIEIAGANAISPKNLVVVRDATTGQPIQSSGRDVFGLLQYEATGVDGAAFNDTAEGNRVKISFVRMNAGLDDLEACPVGDIAGKTINYNYVLRTNLDAITEEAFLSNLIFTDLTAAVDVTLDNAIDNQGSTPATSTTNIRIQLTDGTSWQFEDPSGATDIVRIEASGGGDSFQFNGTTFDINNSSDADFLNGAIFDSGGTPVRVGVTAGYIDTASADLGIRAGGELYLDDSNQTGSTWSQTAGIKLSETTAEWDQFETKFGEVSLLQAIYTAATTGARGTKVYANVTANVAEDVDVGGVAGGANLDAQLPDMSTGTFTADYDVYVNGELQRPGANAGANNDYYPGTSLANGQLKFEYKLRIGDVVCVVPYSA